jgi:flagellar L-ring protein FlgH
VKVAGVCIAVGLALSLNGCSSRVTSLLDQPELTPVGAGLTTESTTPLLSKVLDPAESEDNGPGWRNSSADYFGNQSSNRQGDLVTIKINLNDRATFNNSSSRSKKSNANLGAEFNTGMFGIVGQGAAAAETDSNTSAAGQGTISRSEKLSLSMTAIVTHVFPNGMLYVEGSQETIVNSERRDIRIAGIVHPRDISSDNSVDFSKIAEARVTYGGSGTVSDVQKPGWGMQLWDKVNPF